MWSARYARAGDTGRARVQSDKLKALGFLGNWRDIRFSPEAVRDGVTLACAHQEFDGALNEQWSIETQRDDVPEDLIADLDRWWADPSQTPNLDQPATSEPAGASGPPTPEVEHVPF